MHDSNRAIRRRLTRKWIKKEEYACGDDRIVEQFGRRRKKKDKEKIELSLSETKLSRRLVYFLSRSPAATATPGATGGPAVTAAPAAPLRCNRETLLRWEAPSPRCLDKAAIVSDAESKIDYFPDPWRLHCDTS
ncbi:hypothetical protein AAHE18_09G158500 [Arachis hypogaea]